MAVGSAPGVRTKIKGMQQCESVKAEAKSNGGGSTNSFPKLSVKMLYYTNVYYLSIFCYHINFVLTISSTRVSYVSFNAKYFIAFSISCNKLSTKKNYSVCRIYRKFTYKMLNCWNKYKCVKLKFKCYWLKIFHKIIIFELPILILHNNC